MQHSSLAVRSTVQMTPKSHPLVSHMDWMILGAASFSVEDSDRTRLTASLICKRSSNRSRSDTAAATTRAMMLIVLTKAWSNSSDLLMSAVTNGPTPCNVPHKASPEMAATEAIAPRLPKRNAAHNTGRMARYLN